MIHSVRPLLFILFSLLFFSACNGQNPSGGPAAPSKEPFEGVMTMKTVIPGTGTTTTRIVVGEGGLRAESTASLAGLSARVPVTVLYLTAEPEHVYVLNDASKSYMLFDVPAPDAAAEDSPVDVVVEKLGEEVVNGYPATHVRIAGNGGGESVELWLCRDLLDYGVWSRMQATDREAASAVARRLRQAGLEGFPVRTLHRPSGVVTDLVGLERKRPDPALFGLPEGYGRSDLPAVDRTVLSPEGIEGLKRAAETMRRRLESR